MTVFWNLYRTFYNYYLSPDKAFARALTQLLGFRPRHLNYYTRAFVHRSASEQNQPVLNNERLEYLGDAVLGSVIAEYLFRKYPTKDEGFLTMMRSKIVNRKSLGELAKRLDLDTFMLHQGGDQPSGSMLGNAFEALIGAIYLDMGYERTREFIIRRIVRLNFNLDQLENLDTNYKSRLLEHCQKKHLPLEYKVAEQFKQNRRDKFRIAVHIDGKLVAQGEDFNKKSAEQVASEKALRHLGLLTEEESA
jgi:ribonuclease-3